MQSGISCYLSFLGNIVLISKAIRKFLIHLPSGSVHSYQMNEFISNIRGVWYMYTFFHFYSISNRYSC